MTAARSPTFSFAPTQPSSLRGPVLKLVCTLCDETVEDAQYWDEELEMCQACFQVGGAPHYCCGTLYDEGEHSCWSCGVGGFFVTEPGKLRVGNSIAEGEKADKYIARLLTSPWSGEEYKI